MPKIPFLSLHDPGEILRTLELLTSFCRILNQACYLLQSRTNDVDIHVDSAMFMVGLEDVKGLFQTKRFIILCK